MNKAVTVRVSKRSGRCKLTFVDLFAGCGGLTLGLIDAGWRGLFGIENQPDAFLSYSANFLEGHRHRLDWPRWLEKRAWDIKDLLASHARELRSIRGSVDLVCGGPPCQGFSFSGRRNPRDPRNQLFRRYVDFVDLVRPRFLLIENVPGFGVAHGEKARKERGVRNGPTSFAQKLHDLLEPDYHLDHCLLMASRFGVPQMRDRYFVIGVRRNSGFHAEEGWSVSLIEDSRDGFLRKKGLPLDPVPAAQALRDLEVERCGLVPYERDESCGSNRGYQRVQYRAPGRLNKYMKLMRASLNGEVPTSLRLPRHTPEVRRRFQTILRTFPQGRRLNDRERELLGIAKQRVVPLAPNRPAHTVTTLPDDLIHYAEPRILTVRECARLQSFPDWFEFHGKYTTGGKRRVRECPRYTQVGNAVPPLVAEAWGRAIRRLDRRLA